jgi:hypothetical protein
MPVTMPESAVTFTGIRSEKVRLRDTVIHAHPLASYDQLGSTTPNFQPQPKPLPKTETETPRSDSDETKK